MFCRYATAVNNGVQSLQATQEHALPLQHDIMALKWLKCVHCLYSSGREFQRTGAAYLRDCLPCLVVFTCGICKRLEYMKLYLWPCLLIKSDKTGGARSRNVLNVSSAMDLVLLTWGLGVFALTRMSSKGVKPLIHKPALRTYTKVVPFQEQSSFHLVVLWKLLNGMEWLKLIIEVKYIWIILSPYLMDLVVF